MLFNSLKNSFMYVLSCCALYRTNSDFKKSHYLFQLLAISILQPCLNFYLAFCKTNLTVSKPNLKSKHLLTAVLVPLMVCSYAL